MILVLVDTESFEAGAFVRAAIVGVSTSQDIVDTAFDLPAIARAAYRSLRAIPVAAAVGALEPFA